MSRRRRHNNRSNKRKEQKQRWQGAAAQLKQSNHTSKQKKIKYKFHVVHSEEIDKIAMDVFNGRYYCVGDKKDEDNSSVV